MATALSYEAANLVEFFFTASNPAHDDFPTRFWSGQGDLEFALPGESAKTWLGTKVNEESVLEISSLENTAQGVAERLVMTVAVGKNADAKRHAILERDLGVLSFNLHFIRRDRGSDTWRYFPRTFKGRLSNSRFAQGKWWYDVEGRVHDSERLRSAVWAHENQKDRWKNLAAGNTGDDLGFEYLKDLEAGKKIQWPR